MPQPKIYAAVLNHFGSLSDLAADVYKRQFHIRC